MSVVLDLLMYLPAQCDIYKKLALASEHDAFTAQELVETKSELIALWTLHECKRNASYQLQNLWPHLHNCWSQTDPQPQGLNTLQGWLATCATQPAATWETLELNIRSSCVSLRLWTNILAVFHTSHKSFIFSREGTQFVTSSLFQYNSFYEPVAFYLYFIYFRLISFFTDLSYPPNKENTRTPVIYYNLWWFSLCFGGVRLSQVRWLTRCLWPTIDRPTMKACPLACVLRMTDVYLNIKH